MGPQILLVNNVLVIVCPVAVSKCVVPGKARRASHLLLVLNVLISLKVSSLTPRSASRSHSFLNHPDPCLPSTSLPRRTCPSFYAATHAKVNLPANHGRMPGFQTIGAHTLLRNSSPGLHPFRRPSLLVLEHLRGSGGLSLGLLRGGETGPRGWQMGES